MKGTHLLCRPAFFVVSTAERKKGNPFHEIWEEKRDAALAYYRQDRLRLLASGKCRHLIPLGLSPKKKKGLYAKGGRRKEGSVLDIRGDVRDIKNEL